MANNTQYSRFLIKGLSTQGNEPTINTGSTDHTDGTWVSTDIYKRELLMNTADPSLWTRADDGLHQIPLSDGTGDTYNVTTLSAGTIYSGSTDLYDIFGSGSGSDTFVQDGTNTFTGGTASAPTVNVTGGTFGETTFTADTTFEGSVILCDSGPSTEEITDCASNTIQSGVTASAIIAGTGNTIQTGVKNSVVAGYDINTSVSDAIQSNNSIVRDRMAVGQNTLDASSVFKVDSDGTYSRIAEFVGTGGNALFVYDNGTSYFDNSIGVGGASPVAGTYGIQVDSEKFSRGLNIITTKSDGDAYGVYSDLTDDNSGTNVAGYFEASNSASTRAIAIRAIGTVDVQGTLSADTIISGSTDLYDIFATSSGGEANTASNVGSGVGVFKQKSGVDLEFHSISGDTYLDAELAEDQVNLRLTGSPMDLSFAISDETTAITTGTSKITIYAPYDFEITKIKASVSVSGSTDSEFDVNVNNSSVLSSVLTLSSGDYVTGTTSLSTTSVVEDDKITVDIDTAGTDAAGAKIYILGTRTL